MVNVGFSWSSLLGIVLVVAGAALYFLRSVQPRLARDHDIFFAAVGLLCGGILFFQGWRQDPILQFGQFLLTGTSIFFAVESVRLRGVTAVQAKRSAPIVDDERPVSRVYDYVEAELDNTLEPEEELPPRRRIRGTQESRYSKTQGYEEEVRRRPPSSRSRSEDSYGPEEGPRKRRPRPAGERPTAPPDQWDSPAPEEETPPRPSSARGTAGRKPADASRPKRTRPPQEGTGRPSSYEDEATPADYVEYKPVGDPDAEEDNSANFDR
ncbi:MAG: hypothetical protein KME26_15000 [Oscillatoria princeps RMCB-10]|jgi:hypothetical protein|nr:hypothetical protein [Oscillatoria princeps RMCB-10]